MVVCDGTLAIARMQARRERMIKAIPPGAGANKAIFLVLY